MKNFKKRDAILAAGLLAVSVISAIAMWAGRTPAIHAVVTSDGNTAATLDLSKDTQIEITNAAGGTNTLVVENGEIWCSEASCPDKVCVLQGKKKLDSDIIVCLPNQMIVSIEGGE